MCVFKGCACKSDLKKGERTRAVKIKNLPKNELSHAASCGVLRSFFSASRPASSVFHLGLCFRSKLRGIEPKNEIKRAYKEHEAELIAPAQLVEALAAKRA
jgi:hypothetical protein